MSKFTVLFDYRKGLGRTRSKNNEYGNDTNTVELKPWLDKWENKKRMFNMRLFYVLKPNGENDVIKFGIAGQNSGDGASWGRLHSYINTFGEADDLNRCKGIRLLYLAGNVYNKDVEVRNSDIFKKELACKRYFRNPQTNAHLVGRGYERIEMSRIGELFAIIDSSSNKDFGDVETERRLSERLAQQNLTEDDYIMRIDSHTTLGGKSRARTKYLCYWNRGTVMTKKKLVKLHTKMPKDSDLRDLAKAKEQEARYLTEETESEIDHTTRQFYREIILFNGGQKAVEVYKALHPTANFRD